MEIVVDANVVAEYRRCEIERRLQGNILNSSVTADPTIIFGNLKRAADQVLFDAGGHIEQEWKNVTGEEWFRRKKMDLLNIGGARTVSTIDNRQALIEELRRRGFPYKTNNDRGECTWYIRTAKEANNEENWGYIISEDCDFFDPEAKRNGYRDRSRHEILLSREGPVSDYLYDQFISVHCIKTYVETYLKGNADHE